MPVYLDWQNHEKRILVYTFVGEWTSAEFCKVLEQRIALVQNQQPYTVHSIVDLSETNMVPADLFSHVAFISANTQENDGVIAIVRIPHIIRNVTQLIFRLLPHLRSHVHMVDSADEAIRLINLARVATGELATL